MKKIFFVFLFSAAVLATISGCRKDDPDNTGIPTGTSGNQVSATISGMVLDESNSPLAGVSVSSNGISSSTDQNGIFNLQGNVDKNRCIIQFTKPGFIDRVQALIPRPGKVSYVRIVMALEQLPQNIVSSTGGTVTMNGGASVLFPANSFVTQGNSLPYSGAVQVSARLLAVDDPNFSEMIPGGDLAGKNLSGNDAALYSYGMMNVVLKGRSGELLQLAPGITASITIPIAPAQISTAPATIPLWYFDETTSLWKEEGQAVKTGNNYVGSVSHFTWWNYDYGYGRATITGRVVDCEGIPLSNITVTVNNQMTIVTDQDGNYTSWVPAGFGLTFQVLPQGAINVSSQLENIGALADNQVMTVPDLNIGCGARITGHIINCAHENTSGNIILKVNNYPVYFGFTETGSFNFFVMPNTVYMLEFETEDGVTSQNITSPAPNVTVDLGSIVVCSDASSRNGFTIDGDGFNHFDVNIVRDSVNTLGYSMMYGTFANIWGNYSSDTASIHFEIMADAQHHSNTEPDLFSLSVGGVFYSLSMGTTNDLVLNIDYYGAIGDSIKGTFSGHLYSDLNNQVPVMITNGRFGGIRVQ